MPVPVSCWIKMNGSLVTACYEQLILCNIFRIITIKVRQLGQGQSIVRYVYVQ